MAGESRDNLLDHVVVVVFENRSLDNVLGRLYGPGDGKTFEGVTGKDLTNSIPERAEHGADRKVVPYPVATDLDSPNPHPGEEYPHANTQLFGILSEANRFKLGEEISAPDNAPEPGQAPTMDGIEQSNIPIHGLPTDPDAEIPPDQALHIIHNFLAIQFPLLHPAVPGPVPRSDPDGTLP